jgi:hypothetical protein
MDVGRDIAKGEQVEYELTAMIERRHDKRVVEEGERPAEEMWVESERRHDALRREANRTARVEYHRGQAVRLRAVLEALIAEHEEQAEKYRQPTKGLA